MTTNGEGNHDALPALKSYLRANYAFHLSIYRAAGSESILNVIENLWLQVSSHFNMLHDSGNYTKANEHHRAMFAALCVHDGDAVKIAIQSDIDAAYGVLMDLSADAHNGPARQ